MFKDYSKLILIFFTCSLLIRCKTNKDENTCRKTVSITNRNTTTGTDTYEEKTYDFNCLNGNCDFNNIYYCYRPTKTTNGYKYEACLQYSDCDFNKLPSSCYYIPQGYRDISPTKGRFEESTPPYDGETVALVKKGNTSIYNTAYDAVLKDPDFVQFITNPKLSPGNSCDLPGIIEYPDTEDHPFPIESGIEACAGARESDNNTIDLLDGCSQLISDISSGTLDLDATTGRFALFSFLINLIV